MNYLRQLMILLACCVGGEGISILLGHRLPGNVLGMALLLVLLITGVLRLAQLEKAADFLLQNMAFFFIPACLGILEIFPDIKSELPAIFAVCTLTLLLTASATALTVHLVRKWQHCESEEAFDHD